MKRAFIRLYNTFIQYRMRIIAQIVEISGPYCMRTGTSVIFSPQRQKHLSIVGINIRKGETEHSITNKNIKRTHAFNKVIF